METAGAINGSLQQSYAAHWGDAKAHTIGRKEGEDPVVRICVEIRRLIERYLTVCGALLPVADVITACLIDQRLNGTVDEARWAQLIASCFAAQATKLAVPRRPGMGTLNRGKYQQLSLTDQFWEVLRTRYIR